MLTIVAGTREFNDYKRFSQFMELPDWKITGIITDGHGSICEMARLWAAENNVDYLEMKLQGKKKGKKALKARCEKMTFLAEAGLVLWQEENSSALHCMISQLKKADLVHTILRIDHHHLVE